MYANAHKQTPDQPSASCSGLTEPSYIAIALVELRTHRVECCLISIQKQMLLCMCIYYSHLQPLDVELLR